MEIVTDAKLTNRKGNKAPTNHYQSMFGNHKEHGCIVSLI